MTVAEVIKEFEKYPPDMKVLFRKYSDYQEFTTDDLSIEEIVLFYQGSYYTSHDYNKPNWPSKQVKALVIWGN